MSFHNKYRVDVSLCDALRSVSVPVLRSMDSHFDGTKPCGTGFIALIRSQMTVGGERVFILVMGGSECREMVTLALPRSLINAPDDMKFSRAKNGDSVFFAVCLAKGTDAAGSTEKSVSYLRHSDVTSDAIKSAQTISAQITEFLDDTRPDASDFLTNGNLDLRSLVSLHPKAMEARTKGESTSPGPTKRRRVAVKTEE